MDWKKNKLNESVQNELGTSRQILNIVMEKKLKYIRHATRNTKTNLMAVAYQGKVEGRRKKGRPPITLLDNIKTSTGLEIHEVARSSSDREKWRQTVWNCKKRKESASAAASTDPRWEGGLNDVTCLFLLLDLLLFCSGGLYWSLYLYRLVFRAVLYSFLCLSKISLLCDISLNLLLTDIGSCLVMFGGGLTLYWPKVFGCLVFCMARIFPCLNSWWCQDSLLVLSWLIFLFGDPDLWIILWFPSFSFPLWVQACFCILQGHHLCTVQYLDQGGFFLIQIK